MAKLINLPRNDKYIDLPELFERGVLMGKRPDREGYWKGNITLTKDTQLNRVLGPGNRELLGFEAGFIEGFRCNGGALLLFGNDRNVYYYDGAGDVIDDDDCEGYTYLVHGPFDIRKFGISGVLDLKAKQIWIEEWHVGCQSLS